MQAGIIQKEEGVIEIQPEGDEQRAGKRLNEKNKRTQQDKETERGQVKAGEITRHVGQ